MWTTLKRYSEVLALHSKMKASLGHESLKNFPFPVKSMFNSGDKLKQKRKNSFELYFRLVLELEAIPLEVNRFFGDGGGAMSKCVCVCGEGRRGDVRQSGEAGTLHTLHLPGALDLTHISSYSTRTRIQMALAPPPARFPRRAVPRRRIHLRFLTRGD